MREVRKLRLAIAQDRDFALVTRRKAGVPAFGAQRHPTVGGRDQPAHAQARASTQQTHHAALARQPATDLAALIRHQPRQRHRQRGEVIHHHQRLEPQPLAHLLDGKLPVVVGHAHFIAFDRVGDGYCRVFDLRHLARRQAGEVGRDGSMEVGMLRAPQRHGVLEHRRGRFDGETGVGAADVGQQARAVESGHGGSVGRFGCARSARRQRRHCA